MWFIQMVFVSLIEWKKNKMFSYEEWKRYQDKWKAEIEKECECFFPMKNIYNSLSDNYL